MSSFAEINLITDDLAKLNSQESTARRFTKPCYYTLEQLNDFLNGTKNSDKTKKVEMFFPDLRLFIESSLIAMKKATVEELDQPKEVCE